MCFGSDQSLCKLIRAGGGFVAAGDTLESGNGFIDIHTVYEGTDTLEVAVAATQEDHILQLVILNIKVDGLGADAFGVVLIQMDA